MQHMSTQLGASRTMLTVISKIWHPLYRDIKFGSAPVLGTRASI
jgi:hypothetical protein